MSDTTRTPDEIRAEIVRKQKDAKRLAGNPEKGKKADDEHAFYGTRHQEINDLLTELEAAVAATRSEPAAV